MTEHIPTRPTRPFESLDWYRDATRTGPDGRSAQERFLDWVRGIGFLSLHVSVFALGVVTMFVVNLLRSPDAIWVDRSIPIWSLMVVIHAGLAGLVWAIGLLNRDDDEPIRVVSDASWRRAETWPTSDQTAPSPETPAVPAPTLTAPREVGTPGEQDAAQETVQHPTPPPPAPASPTTKWSGWESDIPQRVDPNDPDRASWREAAAAAWRDRTGSRASTGDDPPDRA